MHQLVNKKKNSDNIKTLHGTSGKNKKEKKLICCLLKLHNIKIKLHIAEGRCVVKCVLLVKCGSGWPHVQLNFNNFTIL